MDHSGVAESVAGAEAMIRYRRSTESGLEELTEAADGCWVDIVDPAPGDASRIARDFDIPTDFVADSLDPDQVSLIERDDGALRLLVRIPAFAGADRNPPYVTVPLGMVVMKERVITISPRRHHLLRDLPHERAQQLDTRKPATFLLVTLWAVANLYLRKLAEIEKILERLEDRLAGSLQNREVLELLRYQKSLEHFTFSLQGNELILDRLQEGETLEIGGDERRLLDDVVIEHRQAIGRVEIASNVLSNMMDAFASIISNNLNAVMKLLTSLTIVLIVSTIIATFYGMNVPLPFQQSPWAFPVIVGLTLVVALLLALIFWKRDWL